MGKNIYQKCERCYNGKLEKYSFWRVLLLLFFIAAIAVPLFFLGKVVLEVLRLKLLNESVPLKSPLMINGLMWAGILALVAIISHYGFNILRQVKALFTRVCPYCEQGFIVPDKVGIIRSTLYFLDLLIFEEILVPMYKALTFQRFWRASENKGESRLMIFLNYSSTFSFSLVPFLVLFFYWKRANLPELYFLSL